MQSKVFVSYSQKDHQFLEELEVYLKPLEKIIEIEFWADTKIRSGQLWKREIEQALHDAIAGVLLISPNFLASKFILEYELPVLLKKTERDTFAVLLVILSASLFGETELAQYQTVNSPQKPLDREDKSERSNTWHNLALRIKELHDRKVAEDALEEEGNVAAMNFARAIKSRYPDMSDEEVEQATKKLIIEWANAIAEGEDIIFTKLTEDQILEVAQFLVIDLEEDDDDKEDDGNN